MASIREATEIIAEATGVDEGTVRQLARCLGEAGMLGPRLPGRKAFQLEPLHIARMIIGLLALGNLGERRNQRVIASLPLAAEMVPVIEALEAEGEPTIDTWLNEETSEEFETLGGSLVRWVAFMIERPDDAENLCQDISITFAADSQYYAIWNRPIGAEEPPEVEDLRQTIFGDMDAVEASGLTRTVKIDGTAIAKVAAAIAPEEAQKSSDSLAASASPSSKNNEDRDERSETTERSAA